MAAEPVTSPRSVDLVGGSNDSGSNGTGAASVQAQLVGDALTVTLAGRLDAESTAAVWGPTMDEVNRRHRAGFHKLVVDATRLDYLDGAGLGLLLELRKQQAEQKREFEIIGLREQLRELLEMYPVEEFIEPTDEAAQRAVIVEIGRAASLLWLDVRSIIVFIGELTSEFTRAVFSPRRVRWQDVALTVETAGVNAIPIVVLLGFLFGFITAFQAAIPLRQFGAELFVADLVAISLLRELGPLLTAIILAGRSGSAFAAELGTMKVNEEIAALTTMGLSPVRFLAVPRVLGAVIVAPLLALICSLCGLVGGGVVCGMLGFPLALFLNQVEHAVTFVDLLGGLFKVSVFALLVAAIGCMRGISTGTGASAVGMSTTRSVVAGLVLIIATDGVFAIVFYYLGI